jgi:uncharacterized protein (TIRG00374 family)
MIFNIILCGVSLAALGYLQENPGFAGAPEQRTILLFMAGLSLVVAGLVLFFFLNPLRRWALQRILGAGRWIKRWVLRRKLDERSWAGNLDRVEKTVAFLQKSRLGLLRVFFWVALNWCFMALAFYFCFHAAGLNLDPGLLLVGFTVMFISSNINPVPAGLGVSESLLAFTYKFLGVGFEPTLVAAILFRLVYYLIPLALATVLYLDKIRLFLKTPVK